MYATETYLYQNTGVDKIYNITLDGVIFSLVKILPRELAVKNAVFRSEE